MIEKIWIYKNKNLKQQDIQRISQENNIPPILATLLLNRGIKQSEILPFMSKSLKNIINPTLMLDMDKAVKRIINAIKTHEKITVYGDYDVDGITSTALLCEFLTLVGANVDYYIPSRQGEGYGINIRAVNKLIKSGTKLLISVDCGITALGETSFAKLQGMDVIITDHHTCKERLPEDAVAVVNPHRPDCEYPFDGLAGVGVAFKLVLAMAIELKINTTKCFNKFIDIAAIGTVADVVPLVDENRIIVDKGVKALQHPSRPGIRALFEIAGVSPTSVTASTIAFVIAPRLNASGRIADASLGVRLLLTKDENEANEIAAELDSLNKQRQATEMDIYRDALSMIAADPNFEKKKVIVLAKEGWHQGVIGIVASKINELYYKPCILISYNENGVGKGSGRSIPGFNLFDALTECEEYLTGFGGHCAAAGLNINIPDLEKFTAAINKCAEKTLSNEDFVPKLSIDCPISEYDATLENVRLLESLEPFGMCNEKPLFSLGNVDTAFAKAVGNEEKHLRLRVFKNGIYLNCIGFNMGRYNSIIKQGDRLDIAFQLDRNSYQGTETVQLLLKDIKIL